MSNTSATGGYISPGSPLLPEDSALNAIFQQAIVGITGLAGSLVRPRWQPVVPRQPEPDTDWCAFGIETADPNDFPALTHDPSGDGSTTLHRHEQIQLLSSFYGPNASINAKTLRDGLYLAQNREALQAQGIGLIGTDAIRTAPDLLNQQWVRRFDLPITFSRHAVRTYPVLNLLSADPVIDTDVHISVNP